jgi:hypothetical protein
MCEISALFRSSGRRASPELHYGKNCRVNSSAF